MGNQATVWLVRDRDLCIFGIYSTLEKAEEALERARDLVNGEEYDITDWDIDKAY